MSSNPIWFKARRYGWGWGAATDWRGWTVYGAYAATLVGAEVFLPPSRDTATFAAVVGGATLILLAVLAIKGEKPGWRWGSR